MRKSIQFLAIGILGVFISSCCSKTNVEPINIWVNGSQVACEGVAPMQCLQIQLTDEIDDSKWELVYSGIEGFDFEEGYIYQLKVTKEELKAEDAPADASTIKYTLVEQLSKEKVPMSIAGEWKLVSLNQKVLELDSNQQAPQVVFDLSESTIAGHGGCNRISMGFELIDKSKIKILPGISTRMACPEPNYEDEFLQTIEGAALYQLSETNLIFYTEEGIQILNFIRL